MKKLLIPIFLIVGLAIMTTSCKKDDPEPPNGEELITTLNYTLTLDDGTTVTLRFSDLDGDGGNDPIITGGTLEANKTYSGSIELLNESITPTEDITEEVLEEAEDHQFFFETTASGVSIAYDDQDADGNPLGLKTTVTTGDAGSDSITITLRHEPAKTGTGVSSGDISNAGGETDIEVTFPINVQ